MSIGIFISFDGLISKIMPTMHISHIDMQNEATSLSAEEFEWYPVGNQF